MPWWRSRGWGRGGVTGDEGDPRIEYVSAPGAATAQGPRWGSAMGEEESDESPDDDVDPGSKSVIHLTADLVYGLDGDEPPPEARGQRHETPASTASTAAGFPRASAEAATAPSSVWPIASGDPSRAVPFPVFTGRAAPFYPQAASASMEAGSGKGTQGGTSSADARQSSSAAAHAAAEEVARERRRAEVDEWERQRARRDAVREATISSQDKRRLAEEEVWRERTARLAAMRASAEVISAQAAERKEMESDRIKRVAEGLRSLEYEAPSTSRVPCSTSRQEVIECLRSELGRSDPLACRAAVDRFSACANLRAGFNQLVALDVEALSRGETRIQAGEGRGAGSA